MPNPSSKPPKRPRDINQLAKFLVDLSTSEAPPDAGPAPEPPANEEMPSEALRQAAAELGRRGGLKGGKARAAKLSPEQRTEIARKAARKRWAKD